MSTIYEALKKVQGKGQDADAPWVVVKRENTSSAPEAERRQTAAKKNAPKGMFRREKIAPIIAFVVTAVFIASIVFVAKRSLYEKQTGTAIKQIAGADSREGAFNEAMYKSNIEPRRDGRIALPGTDSQMTGIINPSLILNGIMYLEEGPRAIINNSIVSEGDIVSGARVKNISKKSVTLESRDAEIKLILK